MRRICGGVLLVLALLAFTACSPAVCGYSGIRLGESGVITMLGLCEDFGELRQMALYEAMPDGGVGDVVMELQRVGDHPAGRLLAVDLSHPGDGWRVTGGQPPTLLDPTQWYEVRAWNEDGNNRTYSFPFRVSELPDKHAATPILVKTYSDGYVFTRMTEATFDTFVDEECARR